MSSTVGSAHTFPSVGVQSATAPPRRLERVFEQPADHAPGRLAQVEAQRGPLRSLYTPALDLACDADVDGGVDRDLAERKRLAEPGVGRGVRLGYTEDR